MRVRAVQPVAAAGGGHADGEVSGQDGVFGTRPAAGSDVTSFIGIAVAVVASAGFWALLLLLGYLLSRLV